MKKFLSIFVLILATLMAVPSMAQTKKKATTKKTTTTSAPAVVKSATQQYGDYLKTQVFSIKRGKSSISVEYPVSGNTELVNSIRDYIKNSLSENYTGSLDTPDGLLKSAIKNVGRGEQLEADIKVGFTSKEVITFLFSLYQDFGGAHGHSLEGGKTFLIADGRDLKAYDYFPKFDNVKKSVIESLAKYFETSVSKLGDELFVSIDELDEPENVYITKEGLNYIWGPEEIAPHFYGLPKATIVTTGIAPLMVQP